MDGWKEYEGKRVFIKLKDGIVKKGREYSGRVLIANDSFVKIIDKFGMKVSFSISDISIIQEQRE